MKFPATHLFDLIKSLTHSEKRYFSLYAQRHYTGSNNSLKLFQAISNQEQYNEAAAIKETGLARNNFAVQKKLLYDQILTALFQYDLSGNLTQQVQQDIFSTQKLLQKGLVTQAVIKLRQTKSEATKYEMQGMLLQIGQIESTIQARVQYKTTSAKDLKEWLREIEAINPKISIENYCKYINSRAQKIQIEAGGKSKAHASAVRELLDEAKGKIRDSDMSSRARMDMLQTEALYYFMDQNTVEAQATNARFISLMESADHWIYFYPQRYFSALNNYLIDCFQLKLEKELNAGLQKMRSLQSHKAFKKTANLESNIFRITYQVELNYIISRGKFADGFKLIPAVSEGLDKYNTIPVHHRMNLQYLSAYILFANASYSEASKLLDIIQQHGRSDTSTILDNAISIIQVVCHYELGNYSILDGLVKSCKRKLTAQKSTIKPDMEFDFLNGILAFSISEPSLKDWKKLSDNLANKPDADTQTPYREYFDYLHYTIAKSKKLSFEKAYG